MEIRKYLIVVAGGSGSRMGADVPKQFIMLGNKPVLQMTIERFVSALPDLKVITVLPEDYVPMWKRLCYENNFTVPQTIVKGGFTRFHSVRNGLEKVPDGAVAAIHDGVRPFVSEKLLRSMFSMFSSEPDKESGLPVDCDVQGVVPVIPCVDTLRPLVRNGYGTLERTSDSPVDRNRVFAVQTPQIFRSGLIKAAYGQAYDTSFTDDASVAEKYGIRVTYIDGERFNIKLTTPDDLRLAEALLTY